MSFISPVADRLAVVYLPLMSVPFVQELQRRGWSFIEVPDEEFETHGCNVLALAPLRVLVCDGSPITRDRLQAAGCEVMTYVGDELSHNRAGGPTCLTRPICAPRTPEQGCLPILDNIRAHGTFCITLILNNVVARPGQLPRSLDEASADLGAPPSRTFWRVTFPLIRPAILSGAILAFTLSFDVVAVTFFLTGREKTLPLLIWGRLRQGISPEINAAATIIVAVSLAAASFEPAFEAGG